MKKQKTIAAATSIGSNSVLITLKLIVGAATGSVSIISEAIHSVGDLLAAVIAFIAVRVSDKEPDKEHPYGHGKYENISGIVEALLIFAAAAWIIIEAIKKIQHPEPISNIGWGAAVMGVSAVVNLFVSRYLYRVAKQTDSIALEADALHLKTDVYTSVGVALGLGVVLIMPQWYILDPLIAIVFAVLILKESYILFKAAFSPLLDHSLSDAEIKQIEDLLARANVSFHALRTRKSGHKKFIEFHLVMDPKTTLQESHALCDFLEELIKNSVCKHAEVHIHVEPTT